MTLLEIGQTGASKQNWRSGPREVLKKLMDEAKDPHAGKVLFSEFLAIILPADVRNAFENVEDERRLVSIVEYWFTNFHRYMAAGYPMPGDEEKRVLKKKSRVIKEEAIREAVREKIKEKAELLLLEWLMPNGKAIGDCTGKEVRHFGRKATPWMSKIAAQVQPTQIVRDVLSEDDLRKMWGK